MYVAAAVLLIYLLDFGSSEVCMHQIIKLKEFYRIINLENNTSILLCIYFYEMLAPKNMQQNIKGIVRLIEGDTFWIARRTGGLFLSARKFDKGTKSINLSRYGTKRQWWEGTVWINSYVVEIPYFEDQQQFGVEICIQ